MSKELRESCLLVPSSHGHVFMQFLANNFTHISSVCSEFSKIQSLACVRTVGHTVDLPQSLTILLFSQIEIHQDFHQSLTRSVFLPEFIQIQSSARVQLQTLQHRSRHGLELTQHYLWQILPKTQNKSRPSLDLDMHSGSKEVGSFSRAIYLIWMDNCHFACR